MFRKILDYILLLFSGSVLIHSKIKDSPGNISIINIGKRFFSNDECIEIRAKGVFETRMSVSRIIEITLSSGRINNSMFVFIGKTYFKIGIGRFVSGCDNSIKYCELSNASNNGFIVKYVDKPISSDDILSISIKEGFISIGLNGIYVCSSCDHRIMNNLKNIISKDDCELKISTLIKDVDVYIYKY